MPDYLLSINQGTTLTQATLYDRSMGLVGCCVAPVKLDEPAPYRFEQDPEAIWASVQETVYSVLADQGVAANDIKGISLTNQRETTLLWDRKTSEPVYPAINWQDRRNTELCDRWRADGREPLLQAKTGLVLDPYFSAIKLAWLFDQVPGTRQRAEAGELCFGTIDTWLLWRLTGGTVHRTDATNAARTLMFNIHLQEWDDELLRLFDIPAAVLPEVMDTTAEFGMTATDFLGIPVPICALIGDQQAALVGQACFSPGAAKATFGDGCFALVNTGDKVVASQNRLLATLAYRLQGKPCYAVEGGMFMAGSVIQWLEKDLNMINADTDLEKLAQAVPLDQPEVMVPANSNMSTHYWDQSARGAILGLTRDTTSANLMAAALRSVAYQTEDLLKAMRYDQVNVTRLKVDGGLLTSKWFLQTLADITGIEVMTCDSEQAATRGAAMLGGLQLGWYQNLEQLADLQEPQQMFIATVSEAERDRLLRRWDQAVIRIQAPFS